MRRKVTKQMLAAGPTVIMLFSALFSCQCLCIGRTGNMAGIEGTVPAQAAQDAPEYYAFLRNRRCWRAMRRHMPVSIPGGRSGAGHQLCPLRRGKIYQR